MNMEQWADVDRVANFRRDTMSPLSDTPFGSQMIELTTQVGAVAESYRDWWRTREGNVWNQDPVIAQVCGLITAAMVALCTLAPDADRVFEAHHQSFMELQANLMAADEAVRK
jgi:hypothetical protein